MCKLFANRVSFMPYINQVVPGTKMLESLFGWACRRCRRGHIEEWENHLIRVSSENNCSKCMRVYYLEKMRENCGRAFIWIVIRYNCVRSV